MQIYKKKGDNAIKDLTHWLDYLEHQSGHLAGLVKAKIHRIEQGGPDAKYLRRELDAIYRAFNSHNEFKEAIILHMNDLADAYLAERARALALEKRNDKLWNLAFKGTMEMAQSVGRELDLQLSEIQKKAG